MTKEQQKCRDSVLESLKLSQERVCPDNFVGVILPGKKSCLHFEKSKRENFKEREDTIEQIKKTYPKSKNLVIVLESPHINEYDKCFQCHNTKCLKRSRFIAPALGKTGTMLEKFFLTILKKSNILNNNEMYAVFLMNSIQFQCSNGQNPKICRDFNWCNLWFLGAMKEDFQCRLKQYNPSIVINACTEGGHYKCQNYTGEDPNSKFLETLFKNLDSCNYEKILTSAKGKHLLGYSLCGYVQTAIDEIVDATCKKYYVKHPSYWKEKEIKNIHLCKV